MRRAIVIVALRDRAVFTARPATEGDDKSLNFIPASALLGWAARMTYEHVTRPFDVFHSARVRFSNGLPLTEDGRIGYPTPQILQSAKGDTGTTAFRDGGLFLDADRHAIAGSAIGDGIQYQTLRDDFLTRDGQVLRPEMGRRLKTAVAGDLAVDGQLFGYAHLEANQKFIATLECDDALPESDWWQVCTAFDGREARLGRSRATEYGARAWCLVDTLPNDTSDPVWPTSSASEGDNVIVWALSDLAVLDSRTGQPTLAPRLDEIFPELHDSSPLDAKRSTVATRKFAPWNGHLNARETERSLIGAGSVLCFQAASANTAMLPNIVGIHTEAGCGRVWVNPPMLMRGSRPRFDPASEAIHPAVVRLLEQMKATSQPRAKPDSQLLIWMKSRVEGRSAAERDRLLGEWRPALESLYVAARQFGDIECGPSASQWGSLGAAVRQAATAEDIRKALFEEPGPVCGRADQSTKSGSWNAEGVIKGNRVTFSAWLETELKKNRSVPIRQLKAALASLADYGRALADKTRESVSADRGE